MWHSYGTFKRMGVETPEFKFFFGNQLEIMENVRGFCGVLSGQIYC